MIKRDVAFKLIYFRNTGKYYFDGEEVYNCRICDNSDVVYMYDYISHIRGLRRNQSQGSCLPGLCSLWLDGYVLINCENGFPHLLLPEKEI